MSAKEKPIRHEPAELPTLDDVANGKVSLDDYEIAHGEDIPELTDDFFARARPISEFPELVAMFERARGQRGPQKTLTKERVGLRLDRAVLDHFRNSGPGWQSRINDVLAGHIKNGG